MTKFSKFIPYIDLDFNNDLPSDTSKINYSFINPITTSKHGQLHDAPLAQANR
jgi:hypothetical protein